MALFSSRSDRAREPVPAPAAGADRDPGEELDELAASESPKKVDQARNDAKDALSLARMADIRAIALIEQGRCPKCGGKLHECLFTAICPECGWYRQRTTHAGLRAVVHLDSGETIECDRVFSVEGNQMLCVVGDVVVAQVARAAIRRVDYQWDEPELELARESHRRRRTGVCSWCERAIDEVELDEGAPFDEYVAFGAFQEKYVFCSRKCLRAFRGQYPVRVHRNCYERNCSECDACMKRFDTQSFRRIRIE